MSLLNSGSASCGWHTRIAAKLIGSSCTVPGLRVLCLCLCHSALSFFDTQVMLDGVIAKPDSSIWELPFLTAEDQSLLGSARGVPAHLIPSNASAKHAKARIVSPKGYQLPPDVPGKS